MLHLFYYYMRDDKKRPVQTYCLIINKNNLDGEHARGMAFCSEKDQPCKKIGRAIASGRAVKALKEKHDLYDKSNKLCVASYKPILTDFEKHLLEKSNP